MKYLINLLFLLGAAFFLGGCSDNGDPVDTPPGWKSRRVPAFRFSGNRAGYSGNF